MNPLMMMMMGGNLDFNQLQMESERNAVFWVDLIADGITTLASLYYVVKGLPAIAYGMMDTTAAAASAASVPPPTLDQRMQGLEKLFITDSTDRRWDRFIPFLVKFIKDIVRRAVMPSPMQKWLMQGLQNQRAQQGGGGVNVHVNPALPSHTVTATDGRMLDVPAGTQFFGLTPGQWVRDRSTGQVYLVAQTGLRPTTAQIAARHNSVPMDVDHSVIINSTLSPNGAFSQGYYGG